MHASEIFIILGTLALQLHVVYSLDYFECYPNDTIQAFTLPNSPAMVHCYAIQESDDRVCKVTMTAGSTAIIEDCKKDKPIYLTCSSDGAIANTDIHFEQQVTTVNITCNEISGTGEPATISNVLSATILYDDQQTISPKYDVTLTLNPTTAVVGQNVILTITYPASYSLQITTCTAYPGTAVHATDSIALVSSWCSSESELITNFASNGANTQATATLKAFKFYNFDNVFLSCDLLVCPPGTSLCITSCSKILKKRSDIDQHGEFTKSVSNVLQVVDIESSASDIASVSFLSFLLAIFLSKV